MNKPVFMSPEHVSRMNEILAADADSKAACASLDRRWDMVYELGREGGTVWWTMSFDPAAGVSFSLAPPERAGDLRGDIVFRGEYRAMMQWMVRMKAGEQPGEEPVKQLGDPGGMTVIGPAFAAAQKAATLDTEIRID